MEEIWKPVVGYEGIYEVSNFGRVKSINYENRGYEQILKPHIHLSKRGNYKREEYSLVKDGRRSVKRGHRLVAEAFIPNPQNKPCIDHIDTDSRNNRVDNLRWVTYKENSANPLTLQHMREAQRGEKSHNFGKPMPKEIRAKISKTHIGMKHSEETKRLLSENRKGMNNPNYGKQHTEETRRKMREAAIGRKRPQSVKDAVSRANSKAIDQYTLDGKFIKTWNSAREAADFNQSKATMIGYCLKGKIKSAYGFYWQYHNNN